MRMIDADALKTKMLDYYSYSWQLREEIGDFFDNAPTIVEFDGEVTKVVVKGEEYFKRPQWIPCSERLPEPRIDVWCNSDLGQTVGYYDETCDMWFKNDYTELIVTAWQPLPDPWKGDGYDY